MTQALASPAALACRRPLWMEASASVADMGTFLPLAVGVSIVCGLNFGMILLCAGAANIYSGWRFGQPIPVQPMKALTAAAIAASWSSTDLRISGLMMGAAVLLLGLSGVVQQLTSRIPQPVVRGIQLAIALLLAFKGLRWLAAVPLLPWASGQIQPNSLLLAAAALALVFHPRLREGWGILAVFALGLLLAHWAVLPAEPISRTAIPTNYLSLGQGILCQLPVTLLNSVVAVCALSESCFPGQGIPPQRVARNVGWMNVIFPLLGGMPMCHGAGGLAALHRSGARTGMAPIFLGTAMLLCGALFAPAALQILRGFPKSLLAVMLLVTCFSLAANALRGLWKLPRQLAIALLTALALSLLQM